MIPSVFIRHFIRYTLFTACLTVLALKPIYVVAATAPTTATNPSTTTRSNSEDPKTETLISARKMTSDDNAGIITATGHVEIARGGYILHADKVTYNTNTGVMHAEGHVALLNPTGEVEFADQEEITGDMKQAFAHNVGIVFPDNSRFAANTAQRYEGRYTVGDNGMYTACNVCKENPNNPPLWQLRGDTIVHDNLEHEVYYHNATMDFAGVPVFYTPYISAPDPTVDRRQGFLSPTPGYSPYLGSFIRIPYYFDIAPNEDAILSPMYSQNGGPLLGGEYRRRFDQGVMQFDANVTHNDLISTAGVNNGEQWRGYVMGNFLYDINDIWRAGTDVAFTSDKSFLQNYRINSMDQLTNRAYVEGFEGRNYAATNMYYFEDLRPGTQVTQPLVLPDAKFNMLGEPGQTLGGRWNIDGGILATSRDNSNQGLDQQGPDTRRLSLDAGWERRYISDTGLVSTLSGQTITNAYWADNVINPDESGENFDNVLMARPFAQANLLTGYPVGRRGDSYDQMLEPLVAFTAAPAYKVDPRQPNEDSLDIDFDETNLFSPNRFTGTDLIEGGNRITYGLRHDINTDGGSHIDMFGGESYDFSKNDSFPGLSGLRDNFSDYVGRIDFVPTDWINLNYGFRQDHQTFAPRREDALLSVGAPIFRPYIRYLEAEETQTDGITEPVEEARVGFDSHFAKYWVLHADHTQEFQPQPGPRTSSLMFGYIDECLIFGITASHDDTNRLDISSGTSVVFHLIFKNVGGIKSDSFTNGVFPPELRQY
jgi:LPS-assembly protein